MIARLCALRLEIRMISGCTWLRVHEEAHIPTVILDMVATVFQKNG